MNRLLIFLAILTLSMTAAGAAVKNIPLTELESASKSAQPGDVLVIEDGVYSDIVIKIRANGTRQKPITVKAATKGGVIITGTSCMKMAGEWTTVEGFHFKNGTPPAGSPVIEFRVGKDAANNCRITECVVDSYNPKTRDIRYSYVDMYGRYNRFDHNSLLNKLNSGVALIVMLPQERDQKNHHRIDHNYFGPRPIFGSNGAEMIRVGTSVQSMESSNTVIERNWFDECNGEVEVISIKSSDNIVRDNVFYMCQGVLALRHGVRNTASGNLFIGNKHRNTGGVRIVDAGHKVIDNIFYRLAGERFFSALAVMNAVPNSLPNRYVQVTDVDIERNTFIDCDHISFGVGVDNERTLEPDNIRFKNNIIVNKKVNEPFEELAPVTGFHFEGNLADLGPEFKGGVGFKKVSLPTYEFRGRKIPYSGKYKPPTVPEKPECGAQWYKDNYEQAALATASYTPVEPGQDNLLRAVLEAGDGDILTLVKEGEYPISATLPIDKTVIIHASNDLKSRPVIRYNGEKRDNIITIMDGGSLFIDGLALTGAAEPGKATPYSGISTANGMIEPYLMTVDNCEFYDYPEGSTIPIRGLKNTFSDKIVIKNSLFHAISADAIKYAAERDDAGVYNVEHFTVENCAFNRVLGVCINLYRGGSDESTGGPVVNISNCTFEDVCNKERGSVMRLIGGQVMNISDCNFSNSGRGGASIRLDETVFEKVKIRNCNFWNSGRILTITDKVTEGPMLNEKPEYMDAGSLDFRTTPGTILNDKKIGIR